MHPSESDWNTLYANLKRKTNLDLSSYKANQLQRRILSMLSSKGCTNLAQFWTWMNQSDENTQWFLDKLAINVSELFRNVEKWTEIEKFVLPDLVKLSPRLKVWSAGCSYGAEAHTLAMILDTCFPGSHQIVGTDIDEAALAQAEKGFFSDADVRGVPERFKRYVTKAPGGWTSDPKLKKYLSFKRQNLLADRFDTGFDMIICRNVVIYFTDEAKDALYERFFGALKPGGVLFVGSTERVFNSRELGYENYRPFFYRKPELGDKRWRNAS